MRKLLIAAVLVLGAVGFGVWNSNSKTAAAQAAIEAQVDGILANSVHSVQASVSGRDVRLSGIADSEAERDALVGAFEAIEGRGDVSADALEILPKAAPFTIAATRKDGQTLLQGNVPSEAMRDALSLTGASGVEGLRLASGAPERWESAIGAGLVALAKMDEGSVSLNGAQMRLTGLIDLPSERDTVLAALKLPDGFAVKSDIETRDDGQPVAFEITYDPAEGINVDGKLPSGIDIAQIGETLGIAKASGDAKAGLLGDAEPLRAVLSKLSARLANFETANVVAEGETFRLSAVAKLGINAPELQAALSAELGESVEVSLKPSAKRVDFTPTLANCTTQTDQVLPTLSFLSGSPDLAPASAQGIATLAQIMGGCIRRAGLRAELAGHTDNRGNGNYELSAARAQVVRAALIARGLPAQAMSAVGFGPSKPIADNATAEGRAKNRRMTVRWFQ